MKYPDIWGKDIIFAFSGIEGKTDWFNPFVAGTLEKAGTLCFRLDDRRTLYFKNMDKCNILPEIVCSDLIIFKNPDISVVFAEKDVILGKYSQEFLPSMNSETGSIEKFDNVIVCSSKDGLTGLIIEKDKKIFALSYDRTNRNNAIQKAEKTLIDKNINDEVNKKLQFFDKFTSTQFNNDIEEKTYLKAMSIMKVNCESAQGKINSIWTTPDRWPHRDMWFWDSAFHTLGNRYISYDLAEKTIIAVLNCQREDGFISITMNPEKGRVYEDITQPPLFAYTALDLYKTTKNKDFLEFVYNAIKRYIEWLYRNRDNDSDGLLEWLINEGKESKCGESGMDNSPRFDDIEPEDHLAAIDLNCFAVNEIKCLSEIADILKIKIDVDLWKKMAEEKTHLINKYLWDEDDGFYYDRKQNGNFVKVKTPASLLPLFAGISDRARTKRILEKIINPAMFWTKMPIPSVSKDDPSFCKDMWRGGTWLNYNFLVYEGLKKYGFKDIARTLLLKTKKVVEKWYIENGSIFEFYDPDNQIPPKGLPRKDWLGGKGWTRSITDYQWSAAVYVAILNELKKEKN